jgi:hypothetical protein
LKFNGCEAARLAVFAPLGSRSRPPKSTPQRRSTTTPVAGFERINGWEEDTERPNLCSHTNPRKLSAAHTTWTLVAAQLSAMHNPTPSMRTPLESSQHLCLTPQLGQAIFPATPPCVPRRTVFRVPGSLTASLYLVLTAKESLTKLPDPLQASPHLAPTAKAS